MTRLDRDDRVARLRAAAQRKSQEAAARAHRAIITLESRHQAVNFNTVAAAGGVSKDFLYGNPQLRSLIMEKRPGRPSPSVPDHQRTSEASAVVKLAVATEALNRVRQENAQLRLENAALRGELLSARRSTIGMVTRRSR
jgi:Family of unknown function (DUF6262)